VDKKQKKHSKQQDRLNQRLEVVVFVVVVVEGEDEEQCLFHNLT